MDKITIGLIEKVKINNHEFLAKIDTGANKNSICLEIAEKLKLGPVIKTIIVRSSNGIERRPIIKAELEICNQKFNTIFNISDRKKMRYPVLIGQNTLKKGFLIDPSKKQEK